MQLMPLPDHVHGEIVSPHNQSQALLLNLFLLSLILSPCTTEKPGFCLLANLQISTGRGCWLPLKPSPCGASDLAPPSQGLLLNLLHLSVTYLPTNDRVMPWGLGPSTIFSESFIIYFLAFPLKQQHPSSVSVSSSGFRRLCESIKQFCLICRHSSF